MQATISKQTTPPPIAPAMPTSESPPKSKLPNPSESHVPTFILLDSPFRSRYEAPLGQADDDTDVKYQSS